MIGFLGRATTRGSRTSGARISRSEGGYLGRPPIGAPSLAGSAPGLGPQPTANVFQIKSIYSPGCRPPCRLGSRTVIQAEYRDCTTPFGSTGYQVCQFRNTYRTYTLKQGCTAQCLPEQLRSSQFLGCSPCREELSVAYA